VDVDAAVTRPGEHGRREDQPVGRHDQDVEIDLGEPGENVAGLERGRLEEGKPAGPGKDLDRRRLRAQAASAGTVRLRQHQRNLEARAEHRFERRHRKRRRAGKTDAQRQRR